MAEPFSTDQITARLADHPGWALNSTGQLERNYTLKNFSRAMLFVNTVGYLAESFDHHPDLLIHGYKQVRVTTMSHDVGGITARDFRLIAAIDALPQNND